MKRLIFIFFTGLSSCKSGINNSLKRFIEKEDMIVLESAVDLFESK